MIYTPFEFAVPSDIASSFTSGEKVVSVVTPMASAPARSTYLISRWIYLQAGTYMLRCAAKSSATWMLNSVFEHEGVRVEQKQLLFTITSEQGVAEREVFVAKSGVKKLDVIVRNTATSVSECYVVFNIRRSGNLIYASDSDGWLASDTGTLAASAMPDMPDARKFLPVFNVNPNWQGGILERISYLTNVLSSSTDAEQRRAMRQHPRRSFEVSFLREKSLRSRLDTFIAGHGHNEFLVPLWHESLRLPYGDPKETVELAFDGYNLLSDGARISDGTYVANGLDLLYDALSNGDVVSDGTQATSNGYKD